MGLGDTLGRTEKPQIQKAEQCILQGIRILDELKLKPQYARGYFYLGELYANASQKKKAIENLKKPKPWSRKMGTDHWLVETRKVLAEL
jgi:hypothetical protein